MTVDEVKAEERYSCVAGPFGSSISSKYFVPDGVPVIRGGNLTDSLVQFVPEGFVFVSEETALRFRAQEVHAGDLVFTCWGTLGQVGLIPEHGPYDRYIISNKQLKLRVNPSICDPTFAYYYFAQPRMVEHIRRIAIGAAVPGINLGILKSLPMPVPPLPVQRKIAAILCAYDDLIENNTRRIAILEEIAQALYCEWFVNFRFPGHQDARMVESEMGPLPDGWRIERLGQLARVNASSLRPQEAPAEIAYVDISSVAVGRIEKIERVRFEEAPGRARRRVQHGDVIWSTVRPNRRSHALILEPPPDLIVSTGFAVIGVTRVPWSYLYQFVTTAEFVGYLTNHATGAAYPAVTGRDFENATVVVPTEELMQRYHDFAEPLYAEREVLLRGNSVLHKTRDLLLPKLVSGEIDVSDLDIRALEAVE